MLLELNFENLTFVGDFKTSSWRWNAAWIVSPFLVRVGAGEGAFFRPLFGFSFTSSGLLAVLRILAGELSWTPFDSDFRGDTGGVVVLSFKLTIFELSLSKRVCFCWAAAARRVTRRVNCVIPGCDILLRFSSSWRNRRSAEWDLFIFCFLRMIAQGEISPKYRGSLPPGICRYHTECVRCASDNSWRHGKCKVDDFRLWLTVFKDKNMSEGLSCHV